MPASCQTTGAAAQSAGWTLSELLISLALMAVLAVVALPAFQGQQRQARRSDAQSALQQLQLAQARWRGTQSSHAAELASSVRGVINNVHYSVTRAAKVVAAVPHNVSLNRNRCRKDSFIRS